MNFKTTIGLVVALLLAIGGVWWARSSSAPTAPSGAVGPKSLTDLKVSDITQYEIRSGTETVCAFTKVDQQWEMVRPFAGPAESATVNADVRRLADLKYTQVFSPGDADQPTADMTLLERPGRIVQLTDTAGQSVTLKIGARQMLSNKTYVQKEGNAAIYLVDADLNKDLKRKPSDYRSKRVSQFTTREAVRISVIGERNYTLSKQGADWTIESPVKARADTSVVNRLLHGLSNLNVSHFVKDSAPSLR
ncbi:MAG: DUF4340 domain-containing protein, partial [Phycisphaerae bacterium]